MTRQLEVGKVYSFDTYAPDVLGTRLINVKCLAIMNAQNAVANGLDIISAHQRVRSKLPTGYNDDPTTMVYVKLQSTVGQETIFSMDWINLSTIEESAANRIVVTLDNVGLNDVENIRKILAINGYDFSIELTER